MASMSLGCIKWNSHSIISRTSGALMSREHGIQNRPFINCIYRPTYRLCKDLTVIDNFKKSDYFSPVVR